MTEKSGPRDLGGRAAVMGRIALRMRGGKTAQAVDPMEA